MHRIMVIFIILSFYYVYVVIQARNHRWISPDILRVPVRSVMDNHSIICYIIMHCAFYFADNDQIEYLVMNGKPNQHQRLLMHPETD